MHRDLEQDNGHSSDSYQIRNCILLKNTIHNGELDRVAELMGVRLKLFFAQLKLFINSVFSEQSQFWVKNVKSVMPEQGGLVVQHNPLFVPSVMKTHILLYDPVQKEDPLQKYQERNEKLSLWGFSNFLNNLRLWDFGCLLHDLDP